MTMMRKEDAAVVDPRVALAQRFYGKTIVVEGGVSVPMGEWKVQLKAAELVKKQCSEQGFQALFDRAVDQDGAAAPGRVLSPPAIETLRMMGDGALAWKTNSGAVVNEFNGVPVRLSDYRVYWGRTTANGRPAPSCGSVKDDIGFGDPGGDCAVCPKTEYLGPDAPPRCRSKSRLYLAAGKGESVVLMDLTAMPRQGFDGLVKEARLRGYNFDQLAVKFWLEEHPRPPAGTNYKLAILRWSVLGLADDGTPEYQDAIANANEVLEMAEESWLNDVAKPFYGGRGPTGRAFEDSGPPMRAVNAAPVVPVATAALDAPELPLCPEDGRYCENADTACRDQCAKVARSGEAGLNGYAAAATVTEIVTAEGDDVTLDFAMTDTPFETGPAGEVAAEPEDLLF